MRVDSLVHTLFPLFMFQIYVDKFLHKIRWNSLCFQLLISPWSLTGTKVSADVQSATFWSQQILNWTPKRMDDSEPDGIIYAGLTEDFRKLIMVSKIISINWFPFSETEI